jgi:hypothetical protein
LDRSALVLAIVRALLRRFATFSTQTDSADLSDGGVTSATERVVNFSWQDRKRIPSHHTNQPGVIGCVGAWKVVKIPFQQINLLYVVYMSLKVAGKAYNTINVHRSMLSQTMDLIEGLPIGEIPLVARLLKACYNDTPPPHSLGTQLCGSRRRFYHT